MYFWDSYFSQSFQANPPNAIGMLVVVVMLVGMVKMLISCLPHGLSKVNLWRYLQQTHLAKTRSLWCGMFPINSLVSAQSAKAFETYLIDNILTYCKPKIISHLIDSSSFFSGSCSSHSSTCMWQTHERHYSNFFGLCSCLPLTAEGLSKAGLWVNP